MRTMPTLTGPRTAMLLLLLTIGWGPPARAQWAPLSEDGVPPPPESSEEDDEDGVASEEARSGGQGIRPLGAVGVGLWAVGSSSRSGPSFAPALALGGGVALGALRLQGWAAATWLREKTAVVTVRQILMTGHGSLSFTVRTRGIDLEAGLLGGIALNLVAQRVEGPIPQAESFASLAPVWGARLQMGWRWTQADPVLELQLLRRGWVFDLIAAFGFRWGLT